MLVKLTKGYKTCWKAPQIIHIASRLVLGPFSFTHKNNQFFTYVDIADVLQWNELDYYKFYSYRTSYNKTSFKDAQTLQKQPESGYLF